MPAGSSEAVSLSLKEGGHGNAVVCLKEMSAVRVDLPMDEWTGSGERNGGTNTQVNDGRADEPDERTDEQADGLIHGEICINIDGGWTNEWMGYIKK